MESVRVNEVYEDVQTSRIWNVLSRDHRMHQYVCTMLYNACHATLVSLSRWPHVLGTFRISAMFGIWTTSFHSQYVALYTR